MPTLTIPLIGSVIEPDVSIALGSTYRGQQFRNVVFRHSKNTVSGGSKIEVRPIRLFTQPDAPFGTGRGTAVMIWTGKGTGDGIITAFGSTNSTIYEGSTSRGSITGRVTFLSETTVSATPNIVALANNGRAWFYPDAGALTEITDAQYPGQAGLTPTGNFVHMDGYAFIACTNGQVWNSDLNSIANWTAGNFVTASDKPDGLLGLARMGDFIYAFGPLSAQAYYNAGNAAGSPLSPVDGTSFAIGAINQYSILQFRDTIAFVGASTENSTGVYIIDGRAPRKISTTSIDEVLSTDVYPKLHQFIDGGKQMLFLGIHASVDEDTDEGYLYDPEIDAWSVVRSAFFVANQTAIRREATGNSYLVAVNDAAAATLSNDTTSYDTAEVIIGPIGNGTAHCINRLQLIGDGYGAASTITATIFVNHTDRAQTGWSSPRTVSMSRPVLHRLGYSRHGQSRLQIAWQGGTNGGATDSWMSAVKVDLDTYEI